MFTITLVSYPRGKRESTLKLKIMENNEQYLNVDTNFNNTFGSLLNKYLPEIEKIKIPANPKYQFQELTKKLYPIYGAGIFKLPYRTFYTDYKLEQSHKKTEQYCKDPIKENRLKYLIACMRKMPY